MTTMNYSPLHVLVRMIFRLSTCLLLLRHDHWEDSTAYLCAAFSDRSSGRRRRGNVGRPTTPRPIIPTNSFAHLSALHDGIDILPAPDGKGMGAFAKEDIIKGTTLGEYTGEILTRRDVEARYWGLRKENRHDRKWRNSRRRRNQGLSGDYLFDMGSDLFIDAEDADVSSWCRFANHANPRDRTADCNVEARARTSNVNTGNSCTASRSGAKAKGGALEGTEKCRLFFVALHDIAAGTEICYDYSDEYWDDATTDD